MWTGRIGGNSFRRVSDARKAHSIVGPTPKTIQSVQLLTSQQCRNGMETDPLLPWPPRGVGQSCKPQPRKKRKKRKRKREREKKKKKKKYRMENEINQNQK